MFDLGVGADGSGVANEGGYFVALNSQRHFRGRGWREQVWNGERIAELVDFDERMADSGFVW